MLSFYVLCALHPQQIFVVYNVFFSDERAIVIDVVYNTANENVLNKLDAT